MFAPKVMGVMPCVSYSFIMVTKLKLNDLACAVLPEMQTETWQLHKQIHYGSLNKPQLVLACQALPFDNIQAIN